MTRVAAAALSALFLLSHASAAIAADQVVFVVRHAERADGGAGVAPGGMMGNDPPLSDAGHERAKRLAAALRSAEVTQIFTTEYVRARQTAAPLAAAAKITATVVPAKDAAGLIQQVRGASGNVLIVGHSNTVPQILQQLGVTTPIAIAEAEYDNLFAVVRPASGEPTLVRLRF
jgi:broad specificity phosphatase PhoE